jgi:GxxExxY protein
MSEQFIDQLQKSLADNHTATNQGSGTWKGLVHAELSHAIIGAAIEVHRHVGPGQLESVYQRALNSELKRRAMSFRAQVPIAVTYKDEPIGEFFADFIIDEKVIVELKAVEHVMAVHTAQVLSYLRATQLRLGLLVNFNTPVLWKGVKRVVL